MPIDIGYSLRKSDAEQHINQTTKTQLGKTGIKDFFTGLLSGDLVEKTFLFLGFSFTDPNLDFIFSRIRSHFEKHQRQHFCIMKKRTQEKDEAKEDADYAAIKQNLIIQDLMRFNIKTVLVDDYSDVTKLLTTIDKRFRRKTVFISGSATSYDLWGQEATEEFVSKLTAALIDKNFRIATGFGLGIGSAVVKGAVQQIYSTNHRSIDEQLLLRPFPLGINDPENRTQTYSRYRNELISQSGIALFVMGNKAVDGQIIKAEGVRAEFEIAKEHGLHLIPIGSSGWMSEDLWKEVIEKLDIFFPKNTAEIKDLMQAIGGSITNPNNLIEPILNMIEYLTKE